MVLHALTLGLDNDSTRRRLFETQQLTLDKAVNLCRLTEDMETEMRKMKVNEEVSAVYKMKAKTRTHVKTPANKSQGPTSSQEEHMCNKCGRKHKARQCAAFGKECFIFKKANHFAKCCRGQNFKASLHGRGGRQWLHTFIHYKPRGFYGTTCKTSIKVPVTGNASVKIATPLWRTTLHDLTPLLQVAAVIRLRSRWTGCPLNIVYIPSHVPRVLVAPFCVFVHGGFCKERRRLSSYYRRMFHVASSVGSVANKCQLLWRVVMTVVILISQVHKCPDTMETSFMLNLTIWNWFPPSINQEVNFVMQQGFCSISRVKYLCPRPQCPPWKSFQYSAIHFQYSVITLSNTFPHE